MLAGAAVLGVAMGLNHLALLAARRQKRNSAADQTDKASPLDPTSDGPVV
jgi:hypothetical protein